MDKSILVIAWVTACCACGTQPDHSVEPYPYPQEDNTSPDSAEPTVQESTLLPKRQYEVKSQTLGGFAEEMQIDLALLQVALASCDLYNKCMPGKRSRVQGCTEAFREACPQCNCSDGCDVPMLQAWCEGKNCRQGIPHEDPRWAECAAGVKARTCDELNTRIECEITQELGLNEIRPLDFLSKKKDWP